MAVIINHAAMERALRTLAAFAKPSKITADMAKAVSEGGRKLVMDEFRDSRDPYGNPWKPLKRERTRDRRARLRAERRGKKSRGMKILIKSGRMRASVSGEPLTNAARVTVSTFYAKFHQDGAKHLEQRAMLPFTDRALPPLWQSMIERISKKILREASR